MIPYAPEPENRQDDTIVQDGTVGEPPSSSPEDGKNRSYGNEDAKDAGNSSEDQSAAEQDLNA